MSALVGKKNLLPPCPPLHVVACLFVWSLYWTILNTNFSAESNHCGRLLEFLLCHGSFLVLTHVPPHLDIMLCLRSQQSVGCPWPWQHGAFSYEIMKIQQDKACKGHNRLDNCSVCYSTCVELGLHNGLTKTCCTALMLFIWWGWWIIFVSVFFSRRAAWTCAAFQWWGRLHWDPQSLQQLQWHHQCSRWR